MWVLRFTHQPLYLRRKSFCIHSCSPFRDSIDAALKCKPGAAPASALRSHPTSNVICEMAINRCSLFWAVTQCMLIVVYRRFGRAYRPHFQRFTQYKKNPENRWKRVYVGRSVNCVTTQKMEDIHMATKVWDLAWILTFWRRTFLFQILAHPVFKMWVIQKPNKVALWNKRHFEGENMEIIQHV